jgi:hypothetical protein
MTFHHRAGKEVFRLRRAFCRIIPEDGEVELFFYAEAAEPAETAPDDIFDPARRPNAEVSIFTDAAKAGSLVGQRFSVPKSYDEDREDHVSCVCYYEHEDLNENVLEILGKQGNLLHVRWTGLTQTLDYDTEEPDVRVDIEGLFEVARDED